MARPQDRPHDTFAGVLVQHGAVPAAVPAGAIIPTDLETCSDTITDPCIRIQRAHRDEAKTDAAVTSSSDCVIVPPPTTNISVSTGISVYGPITHTAANSICGPKRPAHQVAQRIGCQYQGVSDIHDDLDEDTLDVATSPLKRRRGGRKSDVDRNIDRGDAPCTVGASPRSKRARANMTRNGK